MEKYSVLMSVYHKENPSHLKVAMLSMFNQTVEPDDFVLVCDGPLSKELDNVVLDMQKNYKNKLNVVRLNKNSGLGEALNEGLKYCKNELVARMDSDDISKRDRCEKQLKAFEDDRSLAICSGAIEEFIDDVDNIIGRRALPESKEDIIKYSKKRCPFNHMAVMFKKGYVIKAGGYREKYHFFEDYDLWVRLLRLNVNARNLRGTFVYARVSDDMYTRRGGYQYASDLLRFHRALKKTKWSGKMDYITGAIPHAIVCLLPDGIRKKIYVKLLRKRL